MAARIAGFPEYEPDGRPGGVRRLLLLVLLLQCYSLGYGGVLILTGLFSGWVPLVAGVGHLGLGLALAAAHRGVSRRRRAAIWLLRFLAIFLASLLPAYAITEGPAPGLDVSNAAFLGLIALCGVVLFLLTLHSDVRVWVMARAVGLDSGSIPG